jgi:hypothetical protein
VIAIQNRCIVYKTFQYGGLGLLVGLNNIIQWKRMKFQANFQNMKVISHDFVVSMSQIVF